ncbi:polysaccharide deacetylase family protein [Novosphingobium sp. YJ-S2-02]|uniref:Polysaccharide deacetylase family protein n=1 Tax=Novosphingobium aureum TaxID=2792964 RepID=A0A931HB46_9SPHN|nr:polysaccharide deacetylase family protein [Novosphingobium aureum]MBH0112752.1 polysaccharide deacetylase family protein [Novosphingobium aureum]
MPGPNLRIAPPAGAQASFREDFGQRFIVTVDTEEEFDWGAPLRREGHTVLTVPALRKFQEFCEGFDVVPSYLLDYPVAASPLTVEAIGKAVRAGKAEVGVQLHPWVNPPFDEEVNAHNSFAGNLPYELERSKLSRLHARICEAFGTAPLTYRAGRYGLGARTASILEELGIAIDTSVRARFDYSAEGGPNYREHPLHPYWADARRQLLEVPLTTLYWGPLRQLGNVIYPQLWRTPRLRGVLARAGLLERIPLTPEGITAEEALRGVDIAIDDGLPVLVFSFHSPSLVPGHTPYVRSEDDLDALYGWWRTLFTHLARRGIRPVSAAQIVSGVSLD